MEKKKEKKKERNKMEKCRRWRDGNVGPYRKKWGRIGDRSALHLWRRKMEKGRSHLGMEVGPTKRFRERVISQAHVRTFTDSDIFSIFPVEWWCCGSISSCIFHVGPTLLFLVTYVGFFSHVTPSCSQAKWRTKNLKII